MEADKVSTPLRGRNPNRELVMKSLYLILCWFCLLLAACENKPQKPAVSHPVRFTVSASRVFADGTAYDLVIAGQFVKGSVNASLRGEINGDKVNQMFTLEGKHAERWQAIVSRTGFLNSEETGSRVEAGGTMEVHLYGKGDEEGAGEPANPGEWRKLIIEAMKIAQTQESDLPGGN